MHSFTVIHESRNLKQARPIGQYVDLLRYALATPSWDLFIDKYYHVKKVMSILFHSIPQGFLVAPSHTFELHTLPLFDGTS